MRTDERRLQRLLQHFNTEYYDFCIEIYKYIIIKIKINIKSKQTKIYTKQNNTYKQNTWD